MARAAAIARGTAVVLGAAAVTGFAFWWRRRWDVAPGDEKAQQAPPRDADDRPRDGKGDDETP